VKRDEIITELREVEKDLFAFKRARDCIHSRVREMDSAARQALMQDWPAFKVVENGLIMAIVRCEGLVEDYRALLDTGSPDNVIQMERRP